VDDGKEEGEHSEEAHRCCERRKAAEVTLRYLCAEDNKDYTL
jgi:hypothetical protein